MTDISHIHELVESFRRKGHSYVDGDCWYSCPEHPEYCGNDTGCDCGLKEHNAKVDEVVSFIETLYSE